MRFYYSAKRIRLFKKSTGRAEQSFPFFEKPGRRLKKFLFESNERNEEALQANAFLIMAVADIRAVSVHVFTSS
ncbi:MAG: hypothetical protein LBE75_08400 [Burkholderiales bacterium]|jgi:hypothetical protein|nr:hypothetical protein [Burkholderiales bacterium]